MGGRVQGSLMETLAVFQAWILFCFPLGTSCLHGSSPGRTCDATLLWVLCPESCQKVLSEAFLSQITPCLSRLIHQQTLFKVFGESFVLSRSKRSPWGGWGRVWGCSPTAGRRFLAFLHDLCPALRWCRALPVLLDSFFLNKI